MSILVNAYSTFVSRASIEFTHQLQGHRDHSDPELERHLNGASSYFDPEISVFSYVHRRAKPDTFLFEAAIAPLNKRGIPNEAILMIGDSPSNDMAPAKQRGLRTHLIEPGNLSLPQEW